ncbi:hypothetical protein, partial [Undibacterium sp. Ji22W]|uniref:hypothetical protein n=1 Tax=Undibacterium sp. Ji22W TaxID=3413038 RepID=UPI003BF2FD58
CFNYRLNFSFFNFNSNIRNLTTSYLHFSYFTPAFLREANYSKTKAIPQAKCGMAFSISTDAISVKSNPISERGL